MTVGSVAVTSEHDAGSGRPWYREPLVWVLIAIPLSSVVMGVVLITLSVESYDGLVADDYYKRGLEVGRRLERDQAASDLGIAARLTFAVDDGQARVRLASTTGAPPPAALKLTLYHATRQGFDRQVELRPRPDGIFVGPFEPLPVGRWYVQLESVEWRLIGVLGTPGDAASIDLEPRPPERL